MMECEIIKSTQIPVGKSSAKYQAYLEKVLTLSKDEALIIRNIPLSQVSSLRNAIHRLGYEKRISCIQRGKKISGFNVYLIRK